MAQYAHEEHAVSRAANAGVGRPKPAQWQGQYVAGYRESMANNCDELSGLDKLLADSMARSLIRRALTAEQWNLMLAIYSEDEQVAAIDNLARTITSLAGPRNRRVWIACCVSPAMAKKYGRTGYDWDGNATPESTLRRWRSDLNKTIHTMRQCALTHLQVVLNDAGLLTSVSG